MCADNIHSGPPSMERWRMKPAVEVSLRLAWQWLLYPGFLAERQTVGSGQQQGSTPAWGLAGKPRAHSSPFLLEKADPLDSGSCCSTPAKAGTFGVAPSALGPGGCSL